MENLRLVTDLIFTITIALSLTNFVITTEVPSSIPESNSESTWSSIIPRELKVKFIINWFNLTKFLSLLCHNNINCT